MIPLSSNDSVSIGSRCCQLQMPLLTIESLLRGFLFALVYGMLGDRNVVSSSLKYAAVFTPAQAGHIDAI